MLSSIHPLGERSRGQRFWVTAAAYMVAATGAAGALGAALGLIGGWLRPEPIGDAAALVALALVAALGLAHDVSQGRVRLPMVRRQVDEAWLTTYRGWVYGVGYGAQLGIGVATIVTTGLVYLTWAASLLSGSPGTGLAIGATFGLVRAAVILAVARVRTPAQLHSAHRRLDRLRHRAAEMSVATLAAGLTTLALGALS